MLKRTLAIVCLCLLPFSAQGGDETMLSAADPQEIAQVITDMGLRADLEISDRGRPVIRSEYDGYDFNIFFHHCSKGFNCQTLLFSARFTETASQIPGDALMGYNRENRWGKLYFDTTDGTVLEMDVNMVGDTTRSNFETSFDFWIDAFDKFTPLLPY